MDYSGMLSGKCFKLFASIYWITGPNSLFIRILLDKKYALPFKVVDALVFHFIRLSNTYKAKLGDAEKLPVLWHQSLLVFCQRSVWLLAFEVVILELNETCVGMHPILHQTKKMHCSTSHGRIRIRRLALRSEESWSTRSKGVPQGRTPMVTSRWHDFTHCCSQPSFYHCFLESLCVLSARGGVMWAGDSEAT